jgi:predicted metal-dependent hydrolase
MDEIRIDTIVRSRRRTIALIVTPEARVIVRAPLKAPAAVIDDFVRKQQGWIKKKIGEM